MMRGVIKCKKGLGVPRPSTLRVRAIIFRRAYHGQLGLSNPEGLMGPLVVLTWSEGLAVVRFDGRLAGRL